MSVRQPYFFDLARARIAGTAPSLVSLPSEVSQAVAAPYQGGEESPGSTEQDAG